MILLHVNWQQTSGFNYSLTQWFKMSNKDGCQVPLYLAILSGPKWREHWWDHERCATQIWVKSKKKNIFHGCQTQCHLWVDKLLALLLRLGAWNQLAFIINISFSRNPGHHNVNIPTCNLCSQASPKYCSKAMSSRSSSKCPSATTIPVSSFKDLDLPNIPQGKQRCQNVRLRCLWREMVGEVQE